MPFKNEYADIVYSRNSIDHVSNPILTIKEIFRILKPGGYFYFAVYFNSTFLNEHESTVIDDEFLDKYIKPFFLLEILSHDKSIPLQKIFNNKQAGFIYARCQKREKPLRVITDTEIYSCGEILKNFHSAYFNELRKEFNKSLHAYKKLVTFTPVLFSDISRFFYAIIQISSAEKNKIVWSTISIL